MAGQRVFTNSFDPNIMKIVYHKTDCINIKKTEEFRTFSRNFLTDIESHEQHRIISTDFQQI